MGLIPNQLVEVKLHARNIERFRVLGYDLPTILSSHGCLVVKKNETILIKVEDLPPSSEVRVKYVCDACGKTFDTTYAHYVDNFLAKRHGITNCNGCKTGVYLSFYDWFIKNGLKPEDYWSNKNDISAKNIYPGSVKKYWFKCNKTDYHPDYLCSPNNFINGSRCSYCHSSLVCTEDSLGYLFPMSKSVWSEKNLLGVYDYTRSSCKKVLWKCENGIHDDYAREIGSAVRFDFRCPKCSKTRNESLYQKKVTDYLDFLHLEHIHEHDCNLKPINPISGFGLWYDNEISSLKLVIEVHGEQHYNLKRFSAISRITDESEAKLKFENQQWRDKYKEEYAISHGYKYLILPYWVFDKNDTYKELIDEKIASIKMEA